MEQVRLLWSNTGNLNCNSPLLVWPVTRGLTWILLGEQSSRKCYLLSIRLLTEDPKTTTSRLLLVIPPLSLSRLPLCILLAKLVERLFSELSLQLKQIVRWFIQRGRRVSAVARSRPCYILGDVIFIPFSLLRSFSFTLLLSSLVT